MTPCLTALQRKILLNQDVLRINQDVTPQGRPMMSMSMSVWRRDLSDGSVAVAFYNEEDHDVVIGPVDLGDLFNFSKRALVKDVWEGVEHIVEDAVPAKQVMPHCTMLFIVSRLHVY